MTNYTSFWKDKLEKQIEELAKEEMAEQIERLKTPSASSFSFYMHTEEYLRIHYLRFMDDMKRRHSKAESSDD